MQFDVWGQTDVGLKREINQDSILIDRELNLFIVADGMGGHKGGEVASALAVQTARQVVRNHVQSQDHIPPRELLLRAYREASSKIYQKSTHENPELMGMGTTMVSAYVFNNQITIANVGDSRAYLAKGPYLWQLTEDHSLVYEQMKAGVALDEEIDHMVGRNVITRSVGFEKEVQVDILQREIQPGEKYLMCSDGLSGLVPHKKLAEILATKDDDKVVSQCIKEAKKAGGDDNISVILIKFH